MIGARCGNTRAVSGEGGSCYYRSVAFQLCEREQRRYVDDVEVRQLRTRVQNYLQRAGRVPSDRNLLWHHIGSYKPGFAEMPVPQAMPYAIGVPITVHLGSNALNYGGELGGRPIHVRLRGLHYDIIYEDHVLRY